MEFLIVFEERRNIGLWAFYRLMKGGITGAQAAHCLVIHAFGSAARGITFQHGAQGKGVGHIAK